MDINESKLIEAELTLRNLRITKEVTETRRSLVRWLALTFGLISPGESRLSALSVLDAMLYFQFNVKKDPNVPEITEYITNSWGEINEKTLRYHLLQLKKSNILSNSKGRYYLIMPEIGEKYDADLWASNYLDTQINPIKEKVKAAMKELKAR